MQRSGQRSKLQVTSSRNELRAPKKHCKIMQNPLESFRIPLYYTEYFWTLLFLQTLCYQYDIIPTKIKLFVCLSGKRESLKGFFSLPKRACTLHRMFLCLLRILANITHLVLSGPHMNNQIDLWDSASALKSISDLRFDPYPWAIIKLCHPYSLNYKAC